MILAWSETLPSQCPQETSAAARTLASFQTVRNQTLTSRPRFMTCMACMSKSCALRTDGKISVATNATAVRRPLGSCMKTCLRVLQCKNQLINKARCVTRCRIYPASSVLIASSKNAVVATNQIVLEPSEPTQVP